MKPKIRITSFWLAICLVVGLLPIPAFAVGTDTGKAIQLVDNGTAANISGRQADSVYFGTYQQRATETADIISTPSSGVCWKTQTVSCSCFPTKILMYLHITKNTRA